MKMIRTLGLTVVAGVAAMTAMPAMAQTSLSDVLAAARAERAEVRAENSRREAEFRAERNKQQQRLAQVRAQVNAATARSNALDAEFKTNFDEIGVLQSELELKQGEFKELFGAARSAAASLKVGLDSSLISHQSKALASRTDPLSQMAESKKLPSIDQMVGLYDSMLTEIVEQSRVVTFNANVVGADGAATEARVTRVGPFSAFSDGRFLIVDDTGNLAFLARQPGGDAVSSMSKLQNATGSEGFNPGVVDPTNGTLMSLVLESKTLRETIAQGKTVGYVILVVLAFGAVLGVIRWAMLLMTGMAVRGQIRSKTPKKGNPLGRVMMAYDSAKDADVETVALRLDDAILKEIPKLEFGLNLIKVLAAVAPLLGLLGTVIGMINTFQAITLFGTGDPKLMASGISEALVTTVLGLVAAIPLLLIHAFASGASKSVAQILEEQSAGMIADHAESRS